MGQEEFPEWNRDDPEESLQRLYHWTVAHAQKQIDWYDDNRCWKRRLSKTSVVVAVAIGGFGALCPLIGSACSDCGIPFRDLGYIFIALAGVVIIFDRTFGFSSGWMRFVETQMKLQQILSEFRCNWTKMVAKQVPEYKKGDHRQELLCLLCDFTSSVEQSLVNETAAWTAEFRSNLTEIHRQFSNDRRG